MLFAFGSAMKRYTFTARIEPTDNQHSYVLFPFDVRQEFGTGGQVPVKVTFDGVPYTGTMVKYGNPQHMVPLLKPVREQIGKSVGDMVEVVLWRDESVRSVEIPPAFKALLEEAGLLAAFEKLSLTHRKEYVRWVGEAKKEETRRARLTKAIEMVRSGVKTPG
jgi:hypothetical protein